MEIAAAFILIMLALLWAQVCNLRTNSQRIEIIAQCSDEARKRIGAGDPEWARAYDLLDRTTYERHMWALMTFRDPRPLYVQH